jgi:hypothetical protein
LKSIADSVVKDVRPGGIDIIDRVVGGISVAVALLEVGEAFDGVLLGEAAGGGVVPALAVLEEAGGAVVEAARGAVGVESGGVPSKT